MHAMKWRHMNTYSESYSVYPTRNAGDSEDWYKGHQTKDMNCLLFDCYSPGWIPPCMCSTDLSPCLHGVCELAGNVYLYIYIYVHMSHVYNYISMYVQIYCIDKHYTWFSSGINSYRICVICVYIHVLCARCIKKMDQKKTSSISRISHDGWCIRIPFNLYSWASKGAAKQTPSREGKTTPLEACEAR